MEYLSSIDLDGLATSNEQIVRSMVDHEIGVEGCSIICLTTPPGGGSPAGLHTHDFDQIYYVLHGTMQVEIDGATYEAGRNTLIAFPANVPHRNWNDGPDSTVHLAINAPPPPRKPAVENASSTPPTTSQK